MKVLTGRSGCLGKGALRRKAKRRRGLPVVTGLTACALGVAVAAMVATGAPTALAGEAFAAERDSYASFYEYGATDEYEMFASMCRDVLMGVRGGDKAAPRCTALVEEAIQGGIPYDFTLGNAI